MSKQLMLKELERRLKAMDPLERKETINQIRQEIIKNQQQKPKLKPNKKTS